jgi:hypothetical protein
MIYDKDKKEKSKSILYNWEKPKAPVMNRQAAMPDWFKYGELPARSREPMGKSGYAFQNSVNAPIYAKKPGEMDIPDHNVHLKGAGVNYKFPIGKRERMTAAPSASLTNVRGTGFGNQELYSVTIPGAGIGFNFKPNKKSNLSLGVDLSSAVGKPISKEFSNAQATLKYKF